MSGGAASKAKGTSFERMLCRSLSLWISNDQHEDLLWRSAISGGRGTTRLAKHGAQKVSGDICSVGQGGHILTDYYHIEAKHIRNMELASFMLKGTGFLAREWRRCHRQAKSHKKLPMMIVKQNLMPSVVLTWTGDMQPTDTSLLYVPQFECVAYSLAHMLSQPYTIPRLPLTRPA